MLIVSYSILGQFNNNNCLIKSTYKYRVSKTLFYPNHLILACLTEFVNENQKENRHPQTKIRKTKNIRLLFCQNGKFSKCLRNLKGENIMSLFSKLMMKIKSYLHIFVLAKRDTAVGNC